MKLEELDITEEDIAEAGERIDSVVKRFRTTIRPELYILKLTYIDELFMMNPYLAPLVYIAIYGVFMVYGNLMGAFIFSTLAGLIYSGMYVARGRVYKKKLWKKDSLSNEDIRYLCQNRALSIIIHNECEEGTIFTYRRIERQRKKYLRSLRKAMHKQ